MASHGKSSAGSRSHPRCILHADMDAFFASVEQRDRPELRGRPVAVGGTGRRGVVSAASYEARVYGIHSAMPSYEARRLCPELVFLPGDIARYARESRRIFAIFHDFSPAVEGLSLDEAFLDLTGCERLQGPPAQVGARLRARVRAETGLAVSVGIAPVKLVAKIASDAAKPDGLLEVRAEQVRDFLDPLPVRRIWGVGPVAERRLEAAGFRCMGDLARADPRQLEALLGERGLELARLARGEDLREVEPEREAVSYSEENTFAFDVTPGDAAQRGLLEATILTHAEAVARRLRRDGLRARTLVLEWRDARRRSPGPRGHPAHTRRVTLAEATDDGGRIADEVRRLLACAGPREPVRLIGVGATGLEAAEAAQLSLFEAADTEKRRRQQLNRALDEIRGRFGGEAVVRASQGAAERAGLTGRIKRGEPPAGSASTSSPDSR